MRTIPRILIVEDEPAIAELIAVNLRHNGFQPVWAIDADAVVVRPGPRLVDGVQALAAAFFGPEIAGLPALPAEVIQRLR